LPNISKINAVDIGNIAKVDGATSSNIAKVDGLDFVTFTGLLDTYTGAAAAYSVRQLKSGVTVAMRVRRDTAGGTGDDDEADVAFDTSLATPTISLDSAISNASALVTATTLGQFLNVGTVNGTTYTNPDSLSVTASCFVDEWKDQSGNANHVEQAAGAAQAQIHSGTVDTDLITENGKPAIEYTAGTSVMESVSNIGISGTGDRTQFMVGMCTNISTNSTSSFLSYGADGLGTAWQNTFEPWVRVGSGYQSFSGISANTQHLYTTALVSGTNVTDTDAFVNGSAATAGAASSRALNTTNSTLQIGATAAGAASFDGKMQEILVWSNDQITSNRTGIETDINGFFGIY